MKKLIVALALLTSPLIYATDVCEIQTPSNGTQGKVLGICTFTPDSFESEYKFDYNTLKDAQLTKEKVKYINMLLNKGYEIQTDKILIRRR